MKNSSIDIVTHSVDIADHNRPRNEPVQLVKEAYLMARLDESRTTVWRRSKNDPDYPLPIQDGPGKPKKFVKSDCDQYIETIAAKRFSVGTQGA